MSGSTRKPGSGFRASRPGRFARPARSYAPQRLERCDLLNQAMDQLIVEFGYEAIATAGASSYDAPGRAIERPVAGSRIGNSALERCGSLRYRTPKQQIAKSRSTHAALTMIFQIMDRYLGFMDSAGDVIYSPNTKALGIGIVLFR